MASGWMQGTLVSYLAELSSATLKVGLLTNAYTFNPDHKFVSNISAQEASVSGYTGGFGGAGRKTLSGKTITEDTANNRATFDATDPATWTALAAGNTLRYAFICEEITNDAASRVVAILDFGSDYITNGGDFSVAFNALGIAYINC
ncbi:MAG: hypothetical protein ACRC1H_09665 [Caldilineaceae bacterium]